MSTPHIIQLIATLLFIIGASIYYNIRHTLHKRGYQVSRFVYSGPCWGHFKDLVDKSEPAEQRRLKARKRAMSICIVVALALVIISGFIPPGG